MYFKGPFKGHPIGRQPGTTHVLIHKTRVGVRVKGSHVATLILVSTHVKRFVALQ